MKQINNYVLEKLHLNAKYKTKYSTKELTDKLYYFVINSGYNSDDVKVGRLYNNNWELIPNSISLYVDNISNAERKQLINLINKEFSDKYKINFKNQTLQDNPETIIFTYEENK